MRKRRKAIIAQNAVSKLYTFSLAGFPQKVLIEGEKNTFPIVITLHGGPGGPIPFSVGCRGLFPEFTSRFIMVYWDQLGCGINNRPIDESFKIRTFVDMTRDLIKEVKKLFPDNPLYLFSMSWGSVLSALAASQYPQLVDGVVVAGQVINNLFLCDEVTDTLADSSIPKKGKLDKIHHITVQTLTIKDLQLINSSLNKYTDGYVNKKGKKIPIAPIIWGLLTSPDYRFRDFIAIVNNGYRKNAALPLWRELLQIDLRGTLESIVVPYRIIQGDTDIVTSTKTMEELIHQSTNNNLKLTIVKDTGHIPGFDMMGKLLESLLDLANL